MPEPAYSLYLTLRQEGKTIPYPAQKWANSRNHGFWLLKGHPERIAQVPEAKACPGLAHALERINAAETEFYTAGCDYSLNTESNGSHWAKGYIDCIFVDPKQASDCQAYFDLFRSFDAYLRDQDYHDPIDFHWELESVDFIEDNYSGWTLCLWVTTDFSDTAEACQTSWNEAIELFCCFMDQVPFDDGKVSE